jgi:hypothetical protein
LLTQGGPSLNQSKPNQQFREHGGKARGLPGTVQKLGKGVTLGRGKGRMSAKLSPLTVDATVKCEERRSFPADFLKQAGLEAGSSYDSLWFAVPDRGEP